MKKAIQFVIPLLVILLTVSPWKVLNQDWFLLALTAALIIYLVVHKITIERPFWLILAFWIFINVLALTYFNESLAANLYTLTGSVMRMAIAYLLIRLGGVNVLFEAENVSYYLLLIGFPLFFLVELVPGVESILSAIDLGSNEALARDGGWNILVYAKNPWHIFRFTGYAWEPGAAALIIVVGLILCTMRDGFTLDFRKIFYLTALIFTFSTAGYLALVVLIGAYLLHFGLTRHFALFIIAIPFLVLLFNAVYEQDFISGKIKTYIAVSEKNRSIGYDKTRHERLTRYDYVFLAGNLVSKWPAGYGISENGITKSRSGETLRGANSLVSTLVAWGVVGFAFMLIMFHRFFKMHARYFNTPYYNLLLIALLIVLFSNPIERTPLFYGLLFYPLIYGAQIRNALYAGPTIEDHGEKDGYPV